MASYACSVSNLAFHDLTKGRSVMPAIASVLGLGLKFIPTPEDTSGRKTAEVALDRFEREMGWKILYASKAADKKILDQTKLYVRSTKHPPLPPRKRNNRIQFFRKSLLAFFTKYEKGKPNLTFFQKNVR